MEILKNKTALEIGELIRSRQISVLEAVESVYDDIECKDKKLNAYVSLSHENACKEAESVQGKIDSGSCTSPLAGVPLSVKDNICTKDIETTCSSKILKGFKPIYDATVVEKVKSAGMPIIGKLNMDEFAMGSTTETSFYGPARNPWNTERVPGGSSGGAAAAVGGSEASIALGSDTGGSIRQPSSYCGVTGFKPTYGTVSRYGLIAYASSLDQIGPIGKDVRDCAALMDVIKGIDPKDSTSLDSGDKSFLNKLSNDVHGLRIGLPSECFNEGLDDEVKGKILESADTYKKEGAEVIDVSLPFLDYVIPVYYIIASAEASSNLSRFDGVKYGFRVDDVGSIGDLYTKTRTEGFGWEVKKRILLGTFVLSSGYYDAYYKKALQVKSIIKQKFDEIFKKVDIILMPTAPAVAPLLGSSLSEPMKMYLSDIFTVSANIAGLPSISIPCGYDKKGMPIGMQLMGHALNDQTVLDTAFAFQTYTDFHKKIAEVK